MNLPSLEWIDKFPKEINHDGCWIPHNVPNDKGYVQILYHGQKLYLHRISMCVSYNIEYESYLDTLHGDECDRRCFNPAHLKPGTRSENIIDSVRLKRRGQARKTHCKCGREFTNVTNKHGAGKGTSQRYCRYCSKMRQRSRRTQQ